jgi:hypothetical protein
MTFDDSLLMAIATFLEENRDTTIINRVLERCVDVGILKYEKDMGSGSHEKLKLDLIKQLCSVHLSYIIEKESQPKVRIKIDEEINIKVNSLLKWVSRKYSEKIFPFGK